jgi:FxsC-like protein
LPSVEGEGVSDFRFFLSYARRDDVGTEYVKSFYADLAREVGRIAGVDSSLGPQEVGFIDVEGSQPGGNWDAQVSEALQTSKVLVCLYSRGYFNSSYCGQEFEVFRRRLEAARGPGSDDPAPLIVPVLWSGREELPDPLPEAVTRITYTAAEFGADYAEKGLYRLRALKDNAYDSFVIDFARLIVDQGERFRVPRLPQFPSLQEVPNAFRGADGPGASSQVFGPKVAVFVFAAANQSDLRECRSSLHAYGSDGGWDWRPFFPEVEDEVGLLCQEIATGQRLRFQELPVGASLREQIRQAEETNTIVVILVDPWTLRVRRYQEPLSEYDKENFWNSRLVVSWYDGDAETRERRAELERELERTLYRTFSNSRAVRPVRSVAELRKALVEAITEVRDQIVKRADLADVVIGQARPIPQLTVPTGNGM